MGITLPKDSPYYKKVQSLCPESKAAVRGVVPVSTDCRFLDKIEMLFRLLYYYKLAVVSATFFIDAVCSYILFLDRRMVVPAIARQSKAFKSNTHFRNWPCGKHSKVNLQSSLQGTGLIHEWYQEAYCKVFERESSHGPRKRLTLILIKLYNQSTHSIYYKDITSENIN